MAKLSLLALLALALAAGCDAGERLRAEGDGRTATAAAPSAERARAVTRAGLMEHLLALQEIAERHGGNRAAGTPGNAATVAYVSARLREAGFEVGLQPVEFPFFRVRAARLVADGRRLRPGEDFRVLTYSGSGRVAGKARAAAGLGCQQADFARLPDGAVALVRRGRCLFSVKARNAERAGAGAVLLTDPEVGDEPFSATLGAPGIGLPVVALGAEAARRLRPGARARLAVRTVSERRTTHNVLAEGGGTTPDRVLMAGGHLDSVRAGAGLNDNGSGVAALLEVAEALAPRSGGARVRLAFWAAEELGLYGSRRYVRGLSSSERRRIEGYVNLDMVGSPNAVVEVYGGAPRIERALRRALGGRVPEARLGGGSDHAPFRRAGIPVGGIFTGASEDGPGDRPRDPCYHRRCDTIDNVDRRVLLRTARAAAQALAGLQAK
jgi:Zn-dependent M28 family amino/carboxypeptidase